MSTPDKMSQERISSAANDLRVMRPYVYETTHLFKLACPTVSIRVFPGMVKVEAVNLC
jgi:hypothetical protein